MKNLTRIIAAFVAAVLLLPGIPLSTFAEGGGYIQSANVSKSEISHPSSGGVSNITLRGTSLATDNIKVKVTLDGIRQNEIEASMGLNKNIPPTESRILIHLTFPENTTSQDRIYQISFNATGSDEAFQETPSASVTVAKQEGAGEPTEAVIEKIKLDTITENGDPERSVKAEFLISGKNLDPKKIRARVTKNAQEQKEIQNKLNSIPFSGQVLSTISFPPNDTDTPQVYRVYFNADGSTQFDEKNSIDVSIPKKDSGNTNPPGDTPSPPSGSDNLIKQVDSELHELPVEGGTVSFQLITDKSVLADQIRVFVQRNGTEDPAPKVTVSGKGPKKNISVEIPRNTSEMEQVYTLRFKASPSTTDFQEQPAVTIKVAPQSVKVPKISELIVLTPHLPKEGGQTKVTVKGSNLTENIFVKVWKIVGKEKFEQNNLSQATFYGNDRVRTATLTFPAAKDDSDTYLIEAGIQQDDWTHKGEVIVGENISGELITLQPTSTYINGEGTQITLRFDEPIFSVRDLSDVKNGILLDIDGDGNFENLSAQDMIEIRDNLLLVLLGNKVETNAKSKIRINERILKDAKNREGKRNEYFIQKAPPIIFSAEFTEGEKLDYNGGKVVFRFTGENLVRQSGEEKIPPIIQVLELQAKSSEQKIIKSKNEKSTDTEQIFSFIAPKNESDRAKSYMVRVSLDGGRTFSSSIGVNIYDRSKRQIATVFPQGADMNAPVLSFVSIQSYGTIGGGTEEPNRTHTEVPVGQESKKTLAYIYGSNLKKDLTKIKIVDKNGIEWTPVQDSSSDSADQFIMVNLDGTGLEGNGNNQLAEIICPNNISGNQVFRYLIAVDGKNFDQEISVTAEVLDDGISGKRSLDPSQIKEVSVSYVSESEQVIAPTVKTRGYLWNKVISFGVKPISVEGYKIKGYYSIKRTEDGHILSKSDLTNVSVLEDRLKDTDEIRFVYEKTASENNNSVITTQNTLSSRASVRPDSVGNRPEAISDNKTPLSTPESSFALKLSVGADKVIKISDGKESSIPALARVFVQNGTPVIPIRTISDALDFNIRWNTKQKTILLTDEKNEIQIIVGTSAITVNGKIIPEKSLPILKTGRVYISLPQLQSILSSTRGYQLQWDEGTQEILIRK